MKFKALLLLLIVLVSACIGNGSTGYFASDGGEKMVVKNGDSIAVDYVGTLEDGTLFDTSVKERASKAGKLMPGRDYSPLSFTVGAGEMIAGFDKAVVGMKVGETKTVRLAPADAYGEKNPAMVQEVPVSVLEKAGLRNVSVGMKLAANGMPATVTRVSNGNATIDFNHELAGKTLVFEITVRKIG